MTKEARAEARTEAAKVLLDTVKATCDTPDLDPKVLLALLESTRKTAIQAGDQDAAEWARERAIAVRRKVVATEAKKVGVRLVVRVGSKDRTLVNLRLDEEDVTPELEADLTAAYEGVMRNYELMA